MNGDSKSTISHGGSYREIGEFWDTHDLADFWDQTLPAEFDVDLQSQATYYAIDSALSARIVELARQRGVSADTLLNLLVQEKLLEFSDR
jgi:hypothetical protein